MKKFAICIESSHQKGMGHLMRAINLIELLKSKREDYVLILNNDSQSVSFLKKLGINFTVADVNVSSRDWEKPIIRKHKIDIWLNDRLDTSIEHARRVKFNDILLVCLDDKGSGAELADINFGSLPLSFSYKLKGRRVLNGVRYLILAKAIDRYKKVRKKINRTLVALGGSDTYGVTAKVVRILRKIGISATVVTGPLFRGQEELNRVIDGRIIVKKAVPSLIREFADYDIAITGGGITPFEANASGLPCIVIANELFEVPNGKFLEEIGSSVYAGHRNEINKDIFIRNLDIEKMSRKGMDQIKSNGADNMYREIISLC